MITQGSHRIIKITCEKDMELIQDVKIMIYNRDRVLKNYSKEEIQINKNIVSVELTQADTMSFDSGTAYMEMKYMDEDGLVEVSKVKKIYIDARKDDRELEGNPIGNPIEDNFEIDEAGNIIIYKNSSGGGATNEELEAAVKEYFEAHKDELKGGTPNLTIGTVETLDSDSNATATITGDKENPVLNLGIPRGDDGQGGSSGWSVTSINLLKEVLYSCVFSDENGESKVDTLISSLLNNPEPIEKILLSISAIKTKTSYSVNDTLNIDDITVTATYSDDSSSIVSDWTSNVNSIDMTSEGAKTLVITYTENGITKTTNIIINATNSSGNIIEVGKEDTYTYHTIKEAESVANDGDTILIHEGEYEEYSVGTVDKSITYEGVDKENCIVFNGLSDKMYSVFNLTGANKLVKNLTIHQTHSDPQNPDTSTVAYKAYAVHVDSESNIGHTYTIENCILKNRYFACAGIGLWQDATVVVKDCDLDLYDSNRDITGSGAYYCHCNTGSTGVTGQRISLINNNIHAYQSKAIRIDTANQEDSEMICEFINNTCSSDLYGNGVDCVSFSTNEHTTLAETSAGNSVSILNYDAPSDYVAPDGLKDTGYWFVVYNKSKDEYYCGNADKPIIESYKSASKLFFIKTSATSNSINGWKSSDGQTWTQVTTNQICYTPNIRTNTDKDANSCYAFCSSQYNDTIELIDVWSDAEFSWNYGGVIQ